MPIWNEALRRLADNPQTPAVETSLRKLRLWHWERVLSARAAWDACEAGTVTRVAGLSDTLFKQHCDEATLIHRAAWNLHMSAVQTLNTLFPVGDTADRDKSNGLAP